MEANQHNEPWNEQRFTVRGLINFIVMRDAHLDGDQLHELIEQVDKDNPWISYWKGGELAPSIRWMGQAQMQDAASWTNRNYTVDIHPSVHLKADRFYAYHRYLCTLAEKLAAMSIEGVHTVKAYLEIQGGGASYLSPAAIVSLEETLKQPGVAELRALLGRTPSC